MPKIDKLLAEAAARQKQIETDLRRGIEAAGGDETPVAVKAGDIRALLDEIDSLREEKSVPAQSVPAIQSGLQSVSDAE